MQKWSPMMLAMHSTMRHASSKRAAVQGMESAKERFIVGSKVGNSGLFISLVSKGLGIRHETICLSSYVSVLLLAQYFLHIPKSSSLNHNT